MSDNEDSNDGMEELHQIIAEYEAAATTSKTTTGDKPDKLGGTVKEEEPVPHSIEVPMDKVLFHDKAGLIKNLAKAVAIKTEDSESEDEPKPKAKKRKAAWTDADDEEVVVTHVKRESEPLGNSRKEKAYKELLVSRFQRISQPKWASLDYKPKTNGDSDDEELLRTVGFVAKQPGGVLPSHDIDCKRLKDLNRATYAEGTIASIQFHPTSTVALVAGDSAVATMYAIDGRENEKLHNIFFQDFPIKCARITPCGTKAIFGSIRNFYFSYDLLSAHEQRYRLPRDITTLRQFELSPCGRYMAVVGRFGRLYLFHLQSHELIHTYQQNDRIAAVRFTGNSQQLICSSKSSFVNIFSIRQQRLEHTFIDDGCIKGSVLDLSPNQRMLATGSMEGVVNVYDFDKVQKNRTPQPEKAILNLRTAVSDLRFNHTSELLAFCSNAVPNALKLVHFPSATVYANFPTYKSAFGKVAHMNFSPNSGFLAIGAQRKAPLFRLKYFNNY